MNNNNGKQFKQSMFKTVKGKFVLMGAVGIFIALSIGIIGMRSMSENSKSSEVVSLVKDISVLQTENLANDALYQYYVDESYIKATLKNLDEMEKKANTLKEEGGDVYAEYIDKILKNVAKDKENYTELLEFHSSRGYSTEIGKYKEFAASSSDLSASFKSLVNHNEWFEIPWATGGPDVGEMVTIGDHDYIKLVYEDRLPVIGKRNNICLRVGGTLTYKGDYYVKNISFLSDSAEAKVDLTTIDKITRAGDGVVDAVFTEFDGEPAIKVTGKFDADNNRWEEVQATISVQKYNVQNYTTLRYELYLDPAVYEGHDFRYGGSMTGVYGYANTLSSIDNKVNTYSKLIVEGKDITASLSEIETLFAELEENIPAYTTDPSLADVAMGYLKIKKGLFEEIKKIDTQTVAIKADNAEINASLTSLCDQVLDVANTQMNAVKSSVSVVTISFIAVGVVVLLILMSSVSRSIRKSVKTFKKAIDEIAAGNIAVRADASGKDEFAMFAESLNGFIDVLQGMVSKVKSMTNVLAESGVALEESANKSKEVAINLNEAIHQISSGAVEQAGDVERSSQQIIGIRQNINQIFESVTNLSEKSDEMHSNGKEANENMNKLTRSSDKTIDAFHRIEEQVRKTDESVVKIQDAISLIASVADQINLLSLNASIEAARAGEAGKGFAVVATEVAKLASQTNESASIIEGIIQSLSEESNRTVETINEAGEFIKSQKGDIDSTHDIFSNVSTGIEYTQSAVIEVLKQSQACEDSSATIVEIMTNLSAISEENAASAETTSSAMTQLNSETARLAETSAELKHIADTLKQDLDFFKI